MNHIKTLCRKANTLLTLILLALAAQTLSAQEAAAPKWAAKAQKSIVSVLTYDQDGNLLKSGTGFYTTATGEAIADYSLFKDAYSAAVIDQSGAKNAVTLILGVDDTYSLVRFKTDAKKPQPLTLAQSAPSEGAIAFALKYVKGKVNACPSATISAVKPVATDCPYLTLSFAIDESYLGAPLFNAAGEVIATVQPSMGQNGHAMGTKFFETLKIQAIQTRVNTLALESIHIRKGLPDSPEESLIYLYTKSKSATNEDYIDMLDLFVQTYPNHAEGYYRRATPLTDMHRFDEADSDLQTYLKLCEDKALANSKVADLIYSKLVYQPEPAYEKWTYEVAEDYARKATTAAPDNYDYKILLSQILMSKKDFAGALTIYDTINSSEERSPATLYAATLAHEGLGDSASVLIELLDSAVAMMGTPTPADAAPYVLRRGQIKADAGLLRQAVADYNQYCFLSNSNVNDVFYHDRAQLEKQCKMYQQALDDFDMAIGIAPNKPYYYIEKAALLIIANEFDECIKATDKALALLPDNADALRLRGYAKLQSGKTDDGLKDLKQAAELGDQVAKEIIEKF